MQTPPDLTSVKDYLGASNVWTDAEVTSALSAEQAAQARGCRVPALRVATVTTVNTSATITGTFTAADVAAYVTATGIPAGATIVSVAVDGATAVLSAAATASATVAATVAAPWPEDLAEALARRVAHNLALRGLPLGLQASITEAAVATNRVGGRDAEVARLEAPWRRLMVG